MISFPSLPAKPDGNDKPRIGRYVSLLAVAVGLLVALKGYPGLLKVWPFSAWLPVTKSQECIWESKGKMLIISLISDVLTEFGPLCVIQLSISDLLCYKKVIQTVLYQHCVNGQLYRHDFTDAVDRIQGCIPFWIGNKLRESITRQDHVPEVDFMWRRRRVWHCQVSWIEWLGCLRQMCRMLKRVNIYNYCGVETSVDRFMNTLTKSHECMTFDNEGIPLIFPRVGNSSRR